MQYCFYLSFKRIKELPESKKINREKMYKNESRITFAISIKVNNNCNVN